MFLFCSRVCVIFDNIKHRTYFSSLVTPGLGAAGHIRRLSNRFIRDDLPTLGYPTIPARTCKKMSEPLIQVTNKHKHNEKEKFD